jgi:hypothetical protein
MHLRLGRINILIFFPYFSQQYNQLFRIPLWQRAKTNLKHTKISEYFSTNIIILANESHESVQLIMRTGDKHDIEQ